jgi:hypothetical protein
LDPIAEPAGAISDIFSAARFFDLVTPASPTPAYPPFDRASHSIDRNYSNHLTTHINTFSPCSEESQQQSPPRPAASSQQPPGPASPRPSAQLLPQSPQPAGGSTTRKISLTFALQQRRIENPRRSGIRPSRFFSPPPLLQRFSHSDPANTPSTARPLQPPAQCRFHVQDRHGRWNRTCRRAGLRRRHEAADPRGPQQQHHQRRQVQDVRVRQRDREFLVPDRVGAGYDA